MDAQFLKIVRARRALLIYYLLSLIYYLFDPSHRGLCGAPRDLQVVAASAGVHVQHLARKIQALANLALHRLGIDLFDIDAARRDDRVLLVSQRRDRHLPVLDQLHQRLFLLLGHLRRAGRGVDAPPLHGHRPHGIGQQLGDSALHALPALRRKIAGDAVIQRLFVQRGLEVKLANIAVFRDILNIGAGRKHQRTRQAEMRKQCLALLGKQRLAVAQQGQAHVAQRQPHHARAVGVGADQAAQAGLGRHDGMPRLLRQLVAAAVAACGGVADAARRQNRRFGAQFLPAVGHRAAADTVFDQQLFGAAAHKFGIAGIVPQGGQHVGGAVALRKHPPSALGFQRHAQLLKQLHGGRRRKGVQAGIQKPPVVAHKGQKLAHIAVTCDVAASFSRNQQLLPAAAGVMLHHRDAQPLGARRARCHQPCRAAAQNQYIGHGFSLRLRSGRPQRPCNAEFHSIHI